MKVIIVKKLFIKFNALLENPEQLARLTLPNYDCKRPVCLVFAVTHPLQTKTFNRVELICDGLEHAEISVQH